MTNTVYMLNVCTEVYNNTLCVANDKKDIYIEMKADIFREELENCYTTEYIKKNMPFFEYISCLSISDIQKSLKRYEIIQTELIGTSKAIN